MKGKALFAVGVAVGYVWGSKSWPEVYRRVRGGTEKVLKNPEVQENVHQAAETVQESVPDILENLYEAGKKLMEKAETMFPGPATTKAGDRSGSGDRTGSGNRADGSESKVATVPVATGAPDVASDVVSDPALDDTTGTDWTDEGGAAPEGPATNTPPRH
ncbi:hypothetical protein [Paenarthrobacter nitroguajacolicus]|uniref:hypothetical protein n=1 Tax=Paenarthrobacter nitroguajacolicus TaxID=211146 RepID=UPI00248B1A79|nr:hypothetical protein [Paenarthrobacter nitroguajacolicus]MDI2034919.1 hypothetical protein [Paenarthrobacter nitroguajacolicus]